MLPSADNDPELTNWLDFQSESGSEFLRSIATLAKTASLSNYTALRPVLLRLRCQNAEPHSTVMTLTTDEYQVIYNETESANDLLIAFNSFNAAAFNHELPKTVIRWASLIKSFRAPGTPIGLLALPEDQISHPLPDQFRLKIPHIFISERLRGVSPVDEWVLFHEMCHFKARGHGMDFVEVLKDGLEKIKWNVLIGGC